MTVFVQFVSIHKTELLKFPLSNPKLILFTDRTYYKSVEKEMATHSSILAWESHGQRKLAGYMVLGVIRVRHDLVFKPPL